MFCVSIHLLQPEQDLVPSDYTYVLSPAEVSEVIAGTDAILARGVKDEENIKKVGATRVQGQDWGIMPRGF